MESFRRGVRSLLRNPLRGGAIIVLLTISIGMALVMIQVRGSIDSKADEVTESVGTSIQVRPVGAAQGLGQPLTAADVGRLETLDHVLSVDQYLEARYSGDALMSAIDTSAFGDHSGGQPDFFGGDGGGGVQRAIPISFSGVSTTDGRSLFRDGTAVLSNGREFAAEEGSAPLAMIGEALADRNGLTVGSSIQLEDGDPLEVIGIFSSGDQFRENLLYMPLATLQGLLGTEDGISYAVVAVDAVEDLEIVVPNILTELGTDRVDVTSELDRVDVIAEPLDGLRRTSRAGTIAALIGAGAVTLLAAFILVRERTREIGILKAVGASGRQIVTQFAAETLIVTLVAGVLGFLLAVGSAETVAAEFFDPTSETTATDDLGFGGNHGGFTGSATHAGRGGFAGAQFTASSLGPLDISVSPLLLLYALAGAFILALVGTALAAAYILRLRPAEVLRLE